jgi:hypothetical protein
MPPFAGARTGLGIVGFLLGGATVCFAGHAIWDGCAPDCDTSGMGNSGCWRGPPC